MAEMCVNAVLAIADLERRDVNLDLIKVCTQSLTTPPTPFSNLQPQSRWEI